MRTNGLYCVVNWLYYDGDLKQKIFIKTSTSKPFSIRASLDDEDSCSLCSYFFLFQCLFTAGV